MEKLTGICVGVARALGIPISDNFATRFYHMSRVGLVGLVGFVVQTSFFEVIGIQLELLRPSTATLIGGEIAVLLGFALNNHFNFPDRTHPTHIRLFRFHTVVAGSLFLQWLFVFLAEIYFPESTMALRIAYLCGIGLGFLSNYIGYTLWVWRKH